MLQEPLGSQETTDYLDIAFKAATICIALFNAFFAVKIFVLKNKKDDAEKERDRKMQLLKTLVLDHNLKNFYSTFDEIEKKLVELKQSNLTDVDKSKIDTSIAEQFITLRRSFYDSLLAIADPLYDSIKSHADDLQTHFTETIFDQGVNLSHVPKYDELINERLVNTKTQILKEIFSYRGDN